MRCQQVVIPHIRNITAAATVTRLPTLGSHTLVNGGGSRGETLEVAKMVFAPDTWTFVSLRLVCAETAGFPV